MKRHLSIIILLVGKAAATAQDTSTYEQVTQQRAAKIVSGMSISDKDREVRVRDLIARQYQDLSRIHDALDLQMKEIREQSSDDKMATDTKIKVAQTEADRKVELLHKEYLTKLSVELSAEQIEKVKDGMTYGVVPLTYGVYLRMFPSLNEDQKGRLLAWLKEAREIAMDAGSSDAKHAVFGKYKGRINNYLVAQG